MEELSVYDSFRAVSRDFLGTPFFEIRAYSRHWEHEYIFWGTFYEKRAFFSLLAHPKHMAFIIISNENILKKFQGTRLSAIVAPNKHLV